LARDYENFYNGTRSDCGVNQVDWQFTRFGATISMPNAWNCYGSVKHAIDNSGNGSLGGPSFGLGWTVEPYDAPIPWETVENSLSRGDVVVFYSGSAWQHAHIALGTPDHKMFGANNQPTADFSQPDGTWNVTSWKWDTCTSPEYFENINSLRRQLYGSDLLTRIEVLHKN